MPSETVAVLDVGKSNVKLSLVDADTCAVSHARSTPNIVAAGPPYPHFDIERLWDWFVAGLRDFNSQRAIDLIATTTHGACFVLVAGDELALPVLDYEFAGPDSLSAGYDAARGDFAETLSPSLPGGLNAGRQLWWLAHTFPADFARADSLLPYPQYWVMRLTGRKVSEVTSFGAHTDLWNPRLAAFSLLAQREGWAALVPLAVRPWDTVGTVLPEVARAAGLKSDCRVLAGIHDSNAALLPHILSRPVPFALLSTGTWMITFAPGGSVDALDPARDCLANVDAFARPVPSAMCMAGREFEILTEGTTATPATEEIKAVVASRTMALPSLVPGSGPFAHRSGGWTVDARSLSRGRRVAAASLYTALVADTCLRLAGAGGPILVEGPFARNAVFLGALRSLAGRDVLSRPDAAGTTVGAALLALGGRAPPPGEMTASAPLPVDIAAYAKEWQEALDRT